MRLNFIEHCELKWPLNCGILKTQKGTGDTDVQVAKMLRALQQLYK